MTVKSKQTWFRRVGLALGFTLWVVVAFFGAQLLIGAAIYGLGQASNNIFVGVNETVLQTGLSVVVYALSLAIAAGVPWAVFKSQRLKWSGFGFAEALPSWRDIGLAPVIFVMSLVLGVVVMYIAGMVVPGVDLQTEQQIGFDNVTQRYEFIMAFITLVVLAPVFEEILFRGYLYGRIRRYLNAFWTISITAIAFGAMHLYAGADYPLQWNVFISTTVLALGMGLFREVTGNIWGAILVHMMKNGLAFFGLFILPLLGVSLL